MLVDSAPTVGHPANVSATVRRAAATSRRCGGSRAFVEQGRTGLLGAGHGSSHGSSGWPAVARPAAVVCSRCQRFRLSR